MKSNSRGARPKSAAGRVGAWGLSAALLASIGIWMAGCQGSIPPASVMPANPCPTPVLLNGFESLAENGTVNTASGVTYTSAVSLSGFYATQGSHSLDVAVTLEPSGGWNDTLLLLQGFSPNVWSGYSRLQADVYVDPALVAGSTYAQLELFANYNSSSNGAYYLQISSTTPSLLAGQEQTLTWNLDFPAPALPATSALSQVFFVFNNNASPGKGHLYIDNLRLVQKCP